MQELSGFHGLEIALRRFSGARAVRVVHPAGQVIPVHRHDWPLLTIAVLGGYDEHSGQEAMELSGASVSLHPGGRCHANCIHHHGMETISIEFDPDWVGRSDSALGFDRSHYWTSGPVLLAARRLAAHWLQSDDEAALATATAQFIREALSSGPVSMPRWLPEVERLTASLTVRSTADIARALDLNPAFLASAYRRATGQGLGASLRRKRIEAAIHLLRETDEPIAAIAVETGFCDQSHLNRAVGGVVGRTPQQIRNERGKLQAIMAA